MKHVIVMSLFLVVCVSSASAGPIADSAKKQASLAAQQSSAEREVARQKATNMPQMLTGLAMIGGGAALSIYGFTHVTGYEIGGGCNTYYCDNLNINMKEKHNTAMGYAGLGIAGAGAVVALMAKGNAEISPTRIRYRVKF